MSSKLLIGIAVVSFFVGISPAGASARGGGGTGAAPQDGKRRPRVETEAEDISGRTIDRAPSDDGTPAPRPENVSAPAAPPKASARRANGRVNTRRPSSATARTAGAPARANQRTNKFAPPLPAPLFAVTLVTEAPHAAVFVDGASRGLAGADGRMRLQLKSGRYQVIVRPQGKFAHTHDVMIGPGSTIHYVVQNSPTRIKTFVTNTKKN